MTRFYEIDNREQREQAECVSDPPVPPFEGRRLGTTTITAHDGRMLAHRAGRWYEPDGTRGVECRIFGYVAADVIAAVVIAAGLGAPVMFGLGVKEALKAAAERTGREREALVQINMRLSGPLSSSQVTTLATIVDDALGL
jgi:hypothetical protein